MNQINSITIHNRWRAFLFEIAHAEALDMSDFFWYQKGSDHGEQNLSHFRTSRKSGSNFDTVMTEELVSEVRFLTRSDLINGRHPELSSAFSQSQ